MDQRQRRAERDRQERERRTRRRRNEQRESSPSQSPESESIDLSKNEPGTSAPSTPSSSVDLNKSKAQPDFREHEDSSNDLNKVRRPGEPTQDNSGERAYHTSMSIADRISGNRRGRRVDGAAFIFVVAIIGLYYFLNKVTETKVGDGTTQNFDSKISYDPSNLRAADWKGTTAVTTDGRYLFTTNSMGEMYRTSVKDGEMEKLGSNEFEKTNVMFSEMGYIFLFQNRSDYYMVSPVGGASKQSLKKGIDHRRTIAGTVINDTIFTIEKNGQLYATQLHTGESKMLGSPEYSSTKYMFDYADVLYNVESDGNLYKINRNKGTWAIVDDKKKFKSVLALTVYMSKVYFVTNSGSLKSYDLNLGSTQLIGSPVYADAKFLTAIEGILYLITKQGNLLAIRV